MDITKQYDRPIVMRENLGYVYAILCPESNKVKIGVTGKNVYERLKELQTGNPYELIMLAYHPCEFVYDLESKIHRYLSVYHYSREWFNFTDIVQLFIRNNFKRVTTTLYFDSSVLQSTLGNVIFDKNMVDMMDKFWHDDHFVDFVVEPIDK